MPRPHLNQICVVYRFLPQELEAFHLHPVPDKRRNGDARFNFSFTVTMNEEPISLCEPGACGGGLFKAVRF